MMILGLVRNYIPSYQQVIAGGWNIADCASRSYDLEGMQVGTVAAGRIGSAVLRRLKPFDVGLHYTDRHRLPAEVESELGATFHESAAEMVPANGRGDDQRTATPRDRAPLRRRDVRADEARRLPGQHGARQDLRPRRGRPGARVGPARRLCRRRLVPTAGSQRPSLADDAAPRHDPARLGHQPLRAGPVRRGHEGDPRVPLRRAADPRRVSDRRGRRIGRRRGPLLQRRRCNRRVGGGRADGRSSRRPASCKPAAGSWRLAGGSLPIARTQEGPQMRFSTYGFQASRIWV